jgi:hypothetical protein
MMNNVQQNILRSLRLRIAGFQSFSGKIKRLMEPYGYFHCPPMPPSPLMKTVTSTIHGGFPAGKYAMEEQKGDTRIPSFIMNVKGKAAPYAGQGMPQPPDLWLRVLTDILMICHGNISFTVKKPGAIQNTFTGKLRDHQLRI